MGKIFTPLRALHITETVCPYHRRPLDWTLAGHLLESTSSSRRSSTDSVASFATRITSWRCCDFERAHVNARRMSMWCMLWCGVVGSWTYDTHFSVLFPLLISPLLLVFLEVYWSGRNRRKVHRQTSSASCVRCLTFLTRCGVVVGTFITEQTLRIT